MQLNQVEFFAPFHALATVACAVLAVWQATKHHWDAAVMLGVIAVLLALVSLAGFRRRRFRDRQEDRWRPL
jgi:membrane protein implicated in regulation of membrane protease activity